jgi:hypothetical protein
VSLRVLIDGVETTLTFAHASGSRGYEYHTPGHASSHSFSAHPEPGQRIRTNGHDYAFLLHDDEIVSTATQHDTRNANNERETSS